MRILLCPTSFTDPANRFRLLQFVPHLRRAGYQVDVSTLRPGSDWQSPFSRQNKVLYWLSVYAVRYLHIGQRLSPILKAGQYDVVMINRRLLSGSRTWAEMALLRRNPHVIFDFDDAIYLTRGGEKKSSAIIRRSAWITPGNAYLAEYARQYNANVTIVPTVVDLDRYRPAVERVPGPLRIGWSGSRNSQPYALSIIKPVLMDLSRENDFEFVVISNDFPSGDWGNVRLRFIPWQAEREVEDIQQIDIGIMPLADTPFERGKCGLKLLLYGGVGITRVASPVGVNAEIIDQGKNGFLATTHDEWINALRTLLGNSDLRQSMGAAAYRTVKERYSVQAVLPTLSEIFEKVGSRAAP